jgi:hypothetical protein
VKILRLINPRWILFTLLLAAVLQLTGCATDAESDNLSERPWNTPKNWENGSLGGMTGSH